METWMWLLGASIVLFIGSKWYGDRKQRQATSEFFNKVLDNQIDDREKAIEELTRKQNESLNEYYDRIAEHNRTHGTNFPTGK
jgi:uncharacterized membrane protein